MNRLNIVIFDGSFKTTSFINRLISGLSQKHQVSVLGYNSDIITKIQNVDYVDLGNERNKPKFVFIALKLALKTLIKPGGFRRLLLLIKALLKSDVSTIKRINFSNSIIQIQPNIIHLQWPTLLPFCEEVINKTDVKIILSQRGYHINVRALVDDTCNEYFKKWFPKINGFHSVSKAIQVNGNIIYNDVNKIDDVIYSGMDMELIPFNASYKKGSVLKILSIGRSHWIKGYTYMLAVCKELEANNIGFDYTIVGASDDEELMYLIEDYKLTEKVIITPKLTQTEVFQKIQQSSLFVLPSIEEGIANVCLEAMALGLPVISTNCGGMSELITHNKTGWLVPTHNVNALYKEILNFIALDIESIDNIRILARKKVEEQHNANLMIENMLKLYSKVINA